MEIGGIRFQTPFGEAMLYNHYTFELLPNGYSFQTPFGEAMLYNLKSAKSARKRKRFQTPFGEAMLYNQERLALLQDFGFRFKPLSGKLCCTTSEVIGEIKEGEVFQTPFGEAMLYNALYIS